jgi:hypothetical protein
MTVQFAAQATMAHFGVMQFAAHFITNFAAMATAGHRA